VALHVEQQLPGHLADGLQSLFEAIDSARVFANQQPKHQRQALSKDDVPKLH